MNWRENICPKCGNEDQIDVAASVWVRLLSDGTEESQWDGSHEYDDDSEAICRGCGYTGKLGSFATHYCHECGEPMFVEANGVSHHGAPDEIDHDADGDHVAVLDLTASDAPPATLEANAAEK